MPPESYAANLVTPRIWSEADEAPPQLLAALIEHSGIKEDLGALPEDDPADYEENALAAAHVICSQVREALWFPRTQKDLDSIGVETRVTLEDLLETQAANCIGFTVVASECLEASGIGHWIGFANGHSTILMPAEGGKALHMIDPLSSVLSQDLQYSVVSGGSSEDRSVNDDMAEHGRSAIELDSLSLAKRAKGDTVELLKEHTWLTFMRTPVGDRQNYVQALAVGTDYWGRSLHPSKSRIFMSIFLPEEGRQMLHGYDSFRQAYLEDDSTGAIRSLYELRGIYPDLDARQSHVVVKGLIRELAERGKAEYARTLLRGYFESFVLVADDSRVPEAHADCLSIIAREAGDAQSATDAVEIYMKVLGMRKAYKRAIAGKLAKTADLAARLGSKS